MAVLVDQKEVRQPRLVSYESDNELTVVIAGLALGGAEKMVLDWARRIYPKWTVHLIVLRNHPQEWLVPSFVKITRLNNINIIQQLKRLGKQLSKSGNPTALCHLLREPERSALAKFGATIIPVFQNDRQGWIEDGPCIDGAPCAISVSASCKSDLEKEGWQGTTSVIRHIPGLRGFSADARTSFRKEWNIPADAKVIGMVGAVKPQKNYPLALRILKELNKTETVYLAILGGPIGKSGRTAWEKVVSDVHELGVRQRVAMLGFIPDAMKCLPAFDVLLNTSDYEGFSMATTEALIHGMPVVASNVGGQGEVLHENLVLIDPVATEEVWVAALKKVIGTKHETPAWAYFPSYRLWTLASLACSFKHNQKLLFVTANLNSGGAQRSLVNLTSLLVKKMPLEVAVTGNSTASHFYEELTASKVSVFRTAETRDAFDHAEMLVKKICDERIGTVCFWNLDSKIKLLLIKTLQFTDVRFIDVSPGNNSFDELDGIAEFQHMISFGEKEYYERLTKMVLKYNGPTPASCSGKTVVIQNGIPEPETCKSDYSIKGNPKIVVNGRITPTKFVKEIVQSMDYVWKMIPDAELHFYGAAESKKAEYAHEVSELAQPNLGSRIFFHGMTFDAKSRLHEFDAYVVLGKDQGCPNALLEALSVGLPSVGNDDGGTREQIIDGQTGILLDSCDPQQLAQGIVKILSDRTLAEQLGRSGREHVLDRFSMQRMVTNYFTLFAGKKSPHKRLSATRKLLFANQKAA